MTKKEKKERQDTEQKEQSLGLEGELLAKQQEHDQLWDKYLRLQADFDNYKKRFFKEKGEFIKFANEGLIIELLSILDNFERGIKSVEQKHDFDLLHQGVDMISKQLHVLLESKGLKRIKAVDEKFDPHLHEPLDIIEDENVDREMVVEELQSGYLLNERIIRPAKVKVVKPKQKLVSSNEDQEIEEKDIIEEKEIKEEDIDKVE